MNKIIQFLTLFATAILISCDSPNDPSYYLEPDYLVGTWMRVEATQRSDGAYILDTTVYRIGVDQLVTNETSSYLKKPLPYKIVYPKGGYILGYIYNPDEVYDYDAEISSLVYAYVPDVLNGGLSRINFQMYKVDYLWVTVGEIGYPSDVYELRRVTR